MIAETRRRLAGLLGVADHTRIVFTSNATDSLNLALYGSLAEGDHVVTTTMEHNSVLRPLRHLESRLGIETTYVGCGPRGVVDPLAIAAAVRPNTRLIAMTHASNVTGSIQPVDQVGQIAAERNLLFLVDAAQTLGHWPCHVPDIRCSLLAAPCHKGLLGPLGLGLLYVADGVDKRLRSIRQGGTGSISESDRQPEFLPDKYESGNLNVPAIAGLNAGLEYLLAKGLDKLRRQLHGLASRLSEGVAKIPGVTVHGAAESAARVGVISISVEDYDPQEAAGILDASFRIQVRGGLHCAPLAHRTLGTFERGGTVRFSVGPFSTTEHIDAAVAAVGEIASASRPRG
jgi:cysteine desulfurase family protein